MPGGRRLRMLQLLSGPGRGLWPLLVLALAVLCGGVFWSVARQIDGWRQYYFAGATPITACQLTVTSSSQSLSLGAVAIPHRPGFWSQGKAQAAVHASPGPLSLSYLCPIPATGTATLRYLHLGWLFGDRITVAIPEVITLPFSGPRKLVVPLPANNKAYELQIAVVTDVTTKMGLMGLQPMVVSGDSQINSRIFAVDYSLGREQNLFSLLLLMSMALILLAAWGVGIVGPILEPALLYFGLALARAAVGYFADSLGISVVANLLLQIPLATAAGLALMLVIGQSLGVWTRLRRGLAYGVFAVLAGLLALWWWGYGAESVAFSELFQWRRGLMILAALGLWVAYLGTRQRQQALVVGGPPVWLGLLTLVLVLGSLGLDMALAINDAPWRTERYLELLMPLLVAVLVFLSLAQTEKAYARTQLVLSQKQQEAKRLQAIARTVQMIHHDIRKPFAILKMGLANLPAADENVQDFAAEVSQQFAAIENLLAELSHLESPGAMARESVVLADLLHQALKVTLVTKDPRPWQLKITLTHSREPLVDCVKIQRVLINLLENAWDACSLADCPLLWISAADAQQQGFLWCEVGNTDSYVSPEEQQVLFDAFYTKGKSEGTGLGLAIAKKIIEDHGGEISCGSDPNKGTWLRFLLPCGPNVVATQHWQWPAESTWFQGAVTPEVMGFVAGPPVATSAKLKESKAFKKSNRCLMLEDSLFVQEMWAEHWPGTDFCFYDDAVAMLRDLASGHLHASDFAVVLLDYYLAKSKGVSGYQVAQTLRQLHWQQPLVLITSGQPPAAERHLFDFVLGKDPQQAEALASILGRARRVEGCQ